MQCQNKYIGDEKMQKLLNHYQCEMPLEVVKMRFGGAICSPNLELRPTDVIASLWTQDKQPRLQTKEEAELFFKFFMGLWDNIFDQIKNNKFQLSGYIEGSSRSYWQKLCHNRFEEIEQGFIEGFWGGYDNLKIPAHLAEIVDSLSDLAEIYIKLEHKLSQENNIENLIKTIKNTDKTVNHSIAFIIEHLFLPQMNKLQKQ